MLAFETCWFLNFESQWGVCSTETQQFLMEFHSFYVRIRLALLERGIIKWKERWGGERDKMLQYYSSGMVLESRIFNQILKILNFANEITVVQIVLLPQFKMHFPFLSSKYLYANMVLGKHHS